MTRYMLEDEYLELRRRGRIKDYPDVKGNTHALLEITLPEPGGAFVRERVCIVTEPVPTFRTTYGVDMYECSPAEWAKTHRHPDYFYNEDGTN